MLWKGLGKNRDGTVSEEGRRRRRRPGVVTVHRNHGYRLRTISVLQSSWEMPSKHPPVERVPEAGPSRCVPDLVYFEPLPELRSNPRLGPDARIKWWRQSEGTTSDQLVTGDEPAQWVGMGCRNTSPTSPASLLEKKRQPTRCPFPGRSTPQPAAPGTAKRVCKARLCWVWDLELHCSLSAGPHSLLHQAGPPGEPELHSIAPSPRRPTFCPLTHSRRVSLRPDTRLDVLHISI